MCTVLMRMGLCVMFVVAVAGQVGAQADLESQLKLCSDYSRRMYNYGGSFLQFEKIQLENHNAREGGTGRRLSEVATYERNYIDAISDLLFVYARITNEADRISVKAYITKRSKNYGRLTGENIEDVNQSLTYVKSAAITASAAHMRDDLREIKAFLESIELP
jgi:hypothetical protein